MSADLKMMLREQHILIDKLMKQQEREGKLILEMKDEISSLKGQINKMVMKVRKYRRTLKSYGF